MKYRTQRRTPVPIAACLAAVAMSCAAPAAPPARQTLRITTGTPGAAFYPLGQSLSLAYAASMPGVDISSADSAGSVANVESLHHGLADLGLCYADVAYMAYAGRLDNQSKPYDDLRAIAVLELAPVHLVVRGVAGPSSPSSLRGRRVAVGPSGSGSALTAYLVLRAFGIGDGDLNVESLKYNEAAQRLAEGTIDALFVTGGDPVDAVRAATGSGARLVPLNGPAIDELRHDYPFFRPAVIHGGTYPGHPAAIRTIGVDNLLLCRRDLDERLVHDLTSQFFARLPTMSILAGMDLEQAPATPIPLHDGATRYYRERELSR